MPVSDMIGQRRQTLPSEKYLSLPTMMVLTITYQLILQVEIHTRVYTPSDEFYTINTNQSGPPTSARHKLHPRLLRPNQSPRTFPKKQT